VSFRFNAVGLATHKPFGDPMTKLSEKNNRAGATSVKFFWCNTDRGAGTGSGNELEEQMHKLRFAATWVPFLYQSHMERVRRGDLIFMYANREGIVAVGEAQESEVKILDRNDSRRLGEYDDGKHPEEWRIPVKWLVWEESDPCRIRNPLRPAFVEMKKDNWRLKRIRKHFLREPVVAKKLLVK
jgi:hypothetical protein